MKLDLSPESLGRVIVSTVAGTILCVGTALYVDSFNFAEMTDATRLRAIVADVFLPIILAVPLLLFFTGKLRELAISHRRLAVYAATDGLTQVMNRAAFSTLVDAYLKDVRAAENRSKGALLIIDADNFKSVNDHYGHDRGDEALIDIARTIKALIRAPDIVGRLGGEEFGVFLPGANSEQAEQVAERIRESVHDLDFRPAGSSYRLSVSVGGAVFRHRLPYSELFRLADQELYAAKRGGRDRVVIRRVGPDDVPAAA